MIYILFFLFFCMSSCTSPTPKEITKIENKNNIIYFGEAIDKSKEVFLSEIIDSISLIPLQTKSNCLLRNTYWYTHTPPFICSSGLLFNYDGKFITRIGRLGGGPGEEIYKPIDVLYHPKHNKFLSKNSKIITYNKNGEFTGIERQLFKTDHKYGKIISGNDKLIEKAVAGDNFVFNYDYDSLIWMDINLNIIARKKIPKGGDASVFIGGNDQSKYYRLFTTNKDSTLFYNYWNDTIYRVTSSQIEPRWILDFGEKKAPDMIRTNADELKKKYWEEAQHDIMRRRGRGHGVSNYENLEMVLLTKAKKGIWAVYETSDYLFFIWSDIVPYRGVRGITDFYYQIGYYQKSTGQTIAVKGTGFNDDILGTGSFIPLYGVFNDNLMKVIWPFELTELIEKKQAKGEEVHPRLLELHKQMSDEDNPFLMVAHLKK